MKLLFLSELYSTPGAPGRGVPNARIVHALRKLAEVEVISPVPWYPTLATRLAPRLRPLAELPKEEPDTDGNVIRHPRRAHLPGLPAAQAMLYATSLLPALRQAKRRFRPDVLLSAWAYPDGTAAVILGRLLKLPTVVRVMGSDINDYAKRPWRRGQIRWALQRASCVVAVSAALGRELRALNVDPHRIRVIPTGVDVQVFRPMDRLAARRALGLPSTPVILVPSRLSPEKGVDVFIQALARLDASVTAVVAGDGPESPRLHAYANAAGVSQRISFLGFQEPARMPLLFSAADVMCLPSLEEGWPNVLMEAIACGCPVVASNVGGVPEILSLTSAGLLVRPRDVNGLAQALSGALGANWDRPKMRETIKAHTIQASASSYYEACVETASHTP